MKYLKYIIGSSILRIDIIRVSKIYLLSKESEVKYLRMRDTKHVGYTMFQFKNESWIRILISCSVYKLKDAKEYYKRDLEFKHVKII